MNIHKLVSLIVVSLLVAILLASARNSYTRVSDTALADSTLPLSNGGRVGDGGNAPHSAPSQRWLPIIFLNAPADLYWSINGNGGTNPNTNFVGTTDNVTLTFRVSNTVALRIAPATDSYWGFSPDIINGFSGNDVSPGVVGATIGGGGGSGNPNTVTDSFGTIGGGYNNRVGNNSGTVTDSPFATIGGGDNNTASGYGSSIAGGLYNTALGWYGSIGGGSGNQVYGLFGTVGGGQANGATGEGSTVGGGEANSTVKGATVAGGYSNQAFGEYSSVSGGSHNYANGAYATISGGQYNTANGLGATISGGGFDGYFWGNVANGNASTVGGGFGNSIAPNGYYATIAGGKLNTATGFAATIPGGISNLASLTDTFAAGQQAQAVNQGAFVWADSTNAPFASTANDQFLIRANGGVGINTNAPQATLDISGSLRVNAGGTVFNRIQAGTSSVPTSTVASTVFTVTFPSAFSTMPRVIATPRGQDLDDTFVVTTRRISTTYAVFNVIRIDQSAGWTQNLQLDWFAWE